MAAKYKKRTDGRYCTHVVIGTNDDGKPQRKTIYAHTIRELEEKAAELRRQVTTGTVITNESTTVAEWAREWFETYKSAVEYNTYKMYNTVVNAHIIPYMGHMRLIDVRPHHVQKLINDKAAEGLTRAVEKNALTMRQIFNKAVENNLIFKSPAESIDLPKREKNKKCALTDSEKGYIEVADLDLKAKAFIYILLYAGLRKGEALALMKSDIDLKEKSITISKTLITKGNKAEIKMSPKTKAGNRTIPIPNILVETLRAYLPSINSMYIFTYADNEIMSA